jgi:biopolymer transport protein ExbB
MWSKVATFFAQGGPVMVPLFVVAALAFAVLYERWRFFRAAGVADAKPWLTRLADWRNGQTDSQAGQTAAQTGQTATPIGQTAAQNGGKPMQSGLLAEFLARTVRSADWLRVDRAALLTRHEFELRDRLERGVKLLAMLAALAPLLGLLGTVMGMIATFQLMAAVGVTDSRGLSLGIAEALITTQTGLSVALFALVGRRYVAARAERFRQALHQLRAAALAAERGDAERARGDAEAAREREHGEESGHA